MTDLFTQLPHSVRFAEKWTEWIIYKREIKDSYKSPKSAQAKAKQLSRYSEDVAIQMIDESIANGYKGIFPLKATSGKQVEPNTTYKEPKQPTFIPYKSDKPFSRAEGIQHLRDKLKANYENGTPIKDWGDVYTTILREFIEIPGEVGVRLHETEVTEASKKRKRSESQYIGSVTANVRDARLNWQLDFWRKEKRNISLEI